MKFSNVSIEKVKKYWNKRPCNIQNSSAPVGTKKYFDEVEQRKYYVEPHIPTFAQFSKWKGKKVLEIGCGIGTDTVNFARAGALITAVDVSSESLKVAKKRARVFNLQNMIIFYQANAEKLSQYVPIKQYDLVYSFGVIHHTPHPEKVISEIKKFMHQKTVLKIMIYHRYSWKTLWILLKYGKGAFWKLDELLAHYSEAEIGSPVTYVFSKQEAKKLLTGFKILEMKIDHIFPYIVPEYRQYHYKKVWYFRILPQHFFRALEGFMGWHLLITAQLT